jgi:thiol-disulfide isomerase/thioredoxin
MSANEVESALSIPEFKLMVDALAPTNRVLVVRFTAEWCRPCQSIDAYCQEAYTKLPSNVHIIEIDIDLELDLYLFFKKNKLLHGIPTLLAWYPDTMRDEKRWYLSDDSTLSANMDNLKGFFNRCNAKAVQTNK